MLTGFNFVNCFHKCSEMSLERLWLSFHVCESMETLRHGAGGVHGRNCVPAGNEASQFGVKELPQPLECQKRAQSPVLGSTQQTGLALLGQSQNSLEKPFQVLQPKHHLQHPMAAPGTAPEPQEPIPAPLGLQLSLTQSLAALPGKCSLDCRGSM